MISARHSCPPLEELAAFAEGSVPRSEATAIREHLADCDRCLELVGETVHFQEWQESSRPAGVAGVAGDPGAGGAASGSEEDHADRGEIVRGPFGRPKGAALTGLALAATLLIAVIGGVAIVRTSDPYGVEAITADLDPGAGLARAYGEEWNRLGWSVVRGAEGPELSALEQAAFRIGVHTLDVAAAVALRDDVSALYGAHRILEVDDDLALVTSQLIAASVRDALAGEETDWRLAEETADELLGFELEDELEPMRRLGIWAQAARFASLRGDDAYFESRPWRRGLESLGALSGDRVEDAGRQLTELGSDRHAERLAILDPLFRVLGG